MADVRIRRQIALLAAQLMYRREESEYFTAKRKAARQLGVEHRFRPADLPSNAEVRDQIQAMARMHEGEARLGRLRDMRIGALRMMRKLVRFRPRLIGSVWTGHVRAGSDIDLHLFCDSLGLVTDTLDELGLDYAVEHKRITKRPPRRHRGSPGAVSMPSSPIGPPAGRGDERIFTHIHIEDRYPFELTLYPEDKAHYVFKSSITGRAIERASIAQLEAFLRAEDPALDLDRVEDHVDRFELYRLLLVPLEGVKQNPRYHPEGDALYHSLQVFELARAERGYDEEFLLAALLHDVGKAIDPSDHVAAGLQALEGTITGRTATLIAHHMEAHAYRDGTLGGRARLRLERCAEFDDLMLLRELDKQGRQPGVEVCEVGEALDYLRALDADEFGDGAA